MNQKYALPEEVKEGVLRFLSGHYTVTKRYEDRILCCHVLSHYERFCSQHDQPLASRIFFGKLLRKLGVYSSSIVGAKHPKRYVYVGLVRQTCSVRLEHTSHKLGCGKDVVTHCTSALSDITACNSPPQLSGRTSPSSSSRSADSCFPSPPVSSFLTEICQSLSLSAADSSSLKEGTVIHKSSNLDASFLTCDVSKVPYPTLYHPSTLIHFSPGYMKLKFRRRKYTVTRKVQPRYSQIHVKAREEGFMKFLSMKCTVSGRVEDRVPYSELYHAYLTFCTIACHPPVHKLFFGKLLGRMVGVYVIGRFMPFSRHSTSQVHSVVGITIKSCRVVLRPLGHGFGHTVDGSITRDSASSPNIETTITNISEQHQQLPSPHLDTCHTCLPTLESPPLQLTPPDSEEKSHLAPPTSCSVDCLPSAKSCPVPASDSKPFRFQRFFQCHFKCTDNEYNVVVKDETFSM